MLLKKLAGQTAIYGISSIVARLLSYLLAPYLTRFLSRADYGSVTDMYAIIPFALVLLTMGMESGYFRFAGRAESREDKERVFATTWGAVTSVALFFLGIVLLFNNDIADVMGYGDNPSFVSIVAIIIALDAITAIPFAKLREDGRAKTFVVIRLLSVVVNLSMCIGFYDLLPKIDSSLFSVDFGVGYVFVSNLIASFVVLFVLLTQCRVSFFKFSPRVLKTILIYSLPLLLSGIAGTANEFIDRQMIKYMMPEELAKSALGVYGAAVKIGVISLLFTQMYRMAAEPFFLSNFKREDFVNINAQALKYFMIISITIFLTITLFIDLFALIVGKDFREGMYILPVVLVANILSGVVLNLSFWYKQTGKTKFALYVTCFGLLFTVVFNILLIPKLGYYGSAIARLICEIAMVGLSYYLNRRYFPTPYDLKKLGEYVLLGGILYCFGFLTVELPLVLKYLCNLALLIIFVIYSIRREHIDVFGLVKSIIKK